MNEPRVVESVTNECQSLGRAHESSSVRAEQLIACLEGEIAKRDETIARLEPQLNRAIQANYDLREELAACRVAVENCELFRARIVELEEKSSAADDADFNLRGLLKRGAFALGLDPENTSWFEVIGGLEQLRAELDAIKAQEPVAWAGAIEYGVPLLMVEPQNWKATPLYAAPVSEAKAQGVVQWPDADEIMQMAFEEGQPADDASWYFFELEEFDLFIERLMSEVASLNEAPAAPAADAGIVDMYRHLQKVTPYRFKKIQDASITDGGDVMYFHKDRFDAALLADMAANCAAKGVV